MKKSSSISLSRIGLFIVFTAVFNNIYTITVSIIILTLFDYKETIVYLLSAALIYFSFCLQNIDILNSIEYINPIKELMLKRISVLSETAQSVLKLILFDVNDYSNIYNLSHGLTSYYLIKTVAKKKPEYSLILIVMISLLFGFSRKYLIVEAELLIDRFIKEKKVQRVLIILLILLISPNIVNDKSLFIILLIRLFTMFKTDISFEMYLFIIESVMFGYADIISLFMFGYLIAVRIFIYLLSIILIIFPSFEIFYLKIIEIYSDFNNIYTFKVSGKLTLISLIFIIMFVFIFRIRNRYIQVAVISLYLFLNLNVPYTVVSFIDVGQGDAILIETPLNQETVLIDTGSKYSYYRLNRYLNERSVRKIDYLVITHNDEDHAGNKDQIINDFNVETIICEGTDINLKGFSLRYLNLGNYENENDNSLVYYLNISRLSFLFTGDISCEAELSYVENYGYHADVLKVSHHGSATSSSDFFISTVLPEISIISTNGKYNHPSEDTLNTLEKYMSSIITTKNEGNIKFIFFNRLCIVKTNTRWFVII